MVKNSSKFILKLTLGAIITAMAAFGLQAAPAGEEPAKPKKKSVTLEERVEILAEELEKLKLKKAVKKFKSVDGMGPAASGVYHVEDGFSIGGYGELVLTDFRSDYVKDGADTRRLIVYMGYKFNDKIILNTEIEYEHAGFEKNSFVTEVDFAGQTVTKKSNNKAEVFVEFAYLDFLLHEKAKISAGLQLVPFGLTNYLHEPTTFYSVNRPQTEQKIIPTTWREMGVMLRGEFKSGFSYRLGVLNGPQGAGFSEDSYIRDTRGKGSKTSIHDLAYVLNLRYEGIKGLLLGASFYQGDAGQGEIEAVGWKTRINDPRDTILDSSLQSEYSDYVDNRPKEARARVRMAEAHFKYDLGGFTTRGLFARGWISEEDARAVNKATGKNIGMVVEGGYLEVGYNVLGLFKSEQKLVLFVRTEMLNTQKNTLRRYPGGKEDIEDLVCSRILANTCRTVSNADLGIIENSNTWREVYDVPGLANGVNDRRIHTVGAAYFPIPNVVLKLDFEKWDSKAEYPYNIEWKNPKNNQIDRVNFGLGFIF